VLHERTVGINYRQDEEIEGLGRHSVDSSHIVSRRVVTHYSIHIFEKVNDWLSLSLSSLLLNLIVQNKTYDSCFTHWLTRDWVSINDIRLWRDAGLTCRTWLDSPSSDDAYSQLCKFVRYPVKHWEEAERLSQYVRAYVSTRQHTSAHVSTRQHTSAYVSIRQI
jgi:hypothetical protein